MKTRLLALIFVIFLLSACSAYAQVSAWDTISYEKWGFVLQVPTGSVKQDVPSSSNGVCDVYSNGGIVCVIKVLPAPTDLPTSTAIEQAIQAEAKAAPKSDPAKRWEQKSQTGDLFKGLVGIVHFRADDPIDTAVSKIVGSESAFECLSMAPIGDDSSPILRLSVIGPDNRQNDIIATGMGMVAFVNKIKSDATVVSPVESGTGRVDHEPATGLEPKPKSEPWPQLKKGDIELAGVVKSISPDGKSLVLMVDTITLAGEAPIAPSPARAKTVVLRSKLTWLSGGQRIRVQGKNGGVGTSLNADSIELCPERRPSNGSPRRGGPAYAMSS